MNTNPHVISFDDAEDTTDHEARAMIAALQARFGVALARIDELEGAMACICGHTRAQHYAGEAQECTICTAAIVSGGSVASCGCMAFDPLDFVNLLARIDALGAAQPPAPVLCECGHDASDHREDDGTTGTCGAWVDLSYSENGPGRWCRCPAWRPVPQVTS